MRYSPLCFSLQGLYAATLPILILTLTRAVDAVRGQNRWLDGRRCDSHVGEGFERVMSLVEALQSDVTRKDLTILHRVLCRVESQLLGLSDATNNGEKTQS